MAQLTYDRAQQLEEMGRKPISLPADIFFGGNELLQKTPGPHHRPEFRTTGTYNHPNLVEYRKRVAVDRANRFLGGTMSKTELQKVGGAEGIKEALKEHGLALDVENVDIIEMREAVVLAGEDETEQEAPKKKAGRPKKTE